MTLDERKEFVRQALDRKCSCECQEDHVRTCPVDAGGSVWHTWRRFTKSGRLAVKDASVFVKPDRFCLNIPNGKTETFRGCNIFCVNRISRSISLC